MSEKKKQINLTDRDELFIRPNRTDTSGKESHMLLSQVECSAVQWHRPSTTDKREGTAHAEGVSPSRGVYNVELHRGQTVEVSALLVKMLGRQTIEVRLTRITVVKVYERRQTAHRPRQLPILHS
jgi:hypothetical protein